MIKDRRGKELIKLFSCPNKTTAKMHKSGAEDSYQPDRHSHPDEWQAFGKYACTDVVSMREALAVMKFYATLPPSERLLWRIDQAVSDRGRPVDYAYLENAARMMDASDAGTLITLGCLTGAANPTANRGTKSAAQSAKRMSI